MADKLISQLKFHDFSKKTVNSLPETPGVYVYTNEKKKVIYIGKAKNLKSRVRSYKAKGLIGKTEKLVSKIKYMSYIEVSSEMEALLLEARLVKKYKPEYNVALKDDKHPLYVAITKDEYPLILEVRKSDDKKNYSLFLGPFPSSRNLHSVLKMLRRIFPYANHVPGKRKCFYAHIGLCNPCPSVIDSLQGDEKKQLTMKYKDNIRRIRGVLSGRISYVKRDLEKQMRKYSKQEDFENAKAVRDQIKRLDYITSSPEKVTDPYLENPNYVEDVRESEMEELTKIVNKLSGEKLFSSPIKRVECYDIAHIAGTAPTASMVTFIDGTPDKSLYRHFKIYQKNTRSDFASMQEVIKRRTKHIKDWGIPDLLVVDGGKGQITSFIRAINETGNDFDTVVVGLAKKRETLIYPHLRDGKTEFNSMVLPKGGARNFLQRIRDESHRFARRLHHKQLLKDYKS